MQISIKTSKGKNINLEVEDSSNTIDFKIHGEPMRELVLRLGPPPPSRGAAPMVIFAKTLTRTLEVNGSDTIGDVKSKWEETEGVAVSQQRILFQGQQLEDSLTVAECRIKHESTIHVVHRLCGC